MPIERKPIGSSPIQPKKGGFGRFDSGKSELGKYKLPGSGKYGRHQNRFQSELSEFGKSLKSALKQTVKGDAKGEESLFKGYIKRSDMREEVKKDKYFKDYPSLLNERVDLIDKWFPLSEEKAGYITPESVKKVRKKMDEDYRKAWGSEKTKVQREKNIFEKFFGKS